MVLGAPTKLHLLVFELQRCNFFKAVVNSLYQKWGSVLTFDDLTSLRVETGQGPLQLVCQHFDLFILSAYCNLFEALLQRFYSSFGSALTSSSVEKKKSDEINTFSTVQYDQEGTNVLIMVDYCRSKLEALTLDVRIALNVEAL